MPSRLPVPKPCRCGVFATPSFAWTTRCKLRVAINAAAVTGTSRSSRVRPSQGVWSRNQSRRPEFDPHIVTTVHCAIDETIEKDRNTTWQTQHTSPETARAGFDPARAAEIAAHNDPPCRDRLGDHVVQTTPVAARSCDMLNAIVSAMRRRDAIASDNDRFSAHALGAFDHKGRRFLLNIDTYADPTLPVRRCQLFHQHRRPRRADGQEP